MRLVETSVDLCLPAAVGAVVQDYFITDLSNRSPTFVYAGNTVGTVESAPQANPFSFTVAPPRPVFTVNGANRDYSKSNFYLEENNDPTFPHLARAGEPRDRRAGRAALLPCRLSIAATRKVFPWTVGTAQANLTQGSPRRLLAAATAPAVGTKRSSTQAEQRVGARLGDDLDLHDLAVNVATAEVCRLGHRCDDDGHQVAR